MRRVCFQKPRHTQKRPSCEWREFVRRGLALAFARLPKSDKLRILPRCLSDYTVGENSKVNAIAQQCESVLMKCSHIVAG